MRYVGGKSRIAKPIVETIQKLSPDTSTAIEPFMGGGAVTAKLAEAFEQVFASDSQEDLYLMWEAVLQGWTPPTEISESEYAELKASAPSALRGFIGFGGSFGGKFFGGYARGNKEDGTARNYVAESSRAIERIGKSLRSGSVQVELADYREVRLDRPGAILYCDPPYAATQGYSVGGFDSGEFWEWAQDAAQGMDVYVSEYRAPDGWESVWSAPKRQSLSRSEQGRDMRVEHLWRFRNDG